MASPPARAFLRPHAIRVRKNLAIEPAGGAASRDLTRQARAATGMIADAVAVPRHAIAALSTIATLPARVVVRDVATPADQFTPAVLGARSLAVLLGDHHAVPGLRREVGAPDRRPA